MDPTWPKPPSPMPSTRPIAPPPPGRGPGGSSRRARTAQGGREMSRIRRVLHPTDFSRASTPAFKRAVEMAKTNRAELLVLHVMVPAVPIMGDGYVSPQVYEDLEAAARGAAQKQIR